MKKSLMLAYYLVMRLRALIVALLCQQIGIMEGTLAILYINSLKKFLKWAGIQKVNKERAHLQGWLAYANGMALNLNPYKNLNAPELAALWAQGWTARYKTSKSIKQLGRRHNDVHHKSTGVYIQLDNVRR